MIKEILLTALKQGKNSDSLFAIWSWIFAHSDASNIYYGTMKEICEGCKVEYAKVNKAFELQSKWNRKDVEYSIVMRKDKQEFEPIDSLKSFSFYKEIFNIDLEKLTSQYKPIIIIFNDKKISELMKKSSVQVEDKKLPIVNDISIKAKIVKDEIDTKLRNACLDIYIDFYKARFNVKPKIDAIQIKALKSIIQWLKQNKKNGTEVDILTSFNVIFQNWDIYDKFYQNQYKLTQISSNITNLVSFIVNNLNKVNKSKTDKITEFAEQINELIDSGKLKH